jgi:DNA-binding MurR/RpiR family transcriptional regulator
MMLDQIATKADIAALHAQLLQIARRLDTITPPREWLTIAEFAAEAGLSPSTVRRRVAQGQIEARGNGKLRRVRRPR